MLSAPYFTSLLSFIHIIDAPRLDIYDVDAFLLSPYARFGADRAATPSFAFIDFSRPSCPSKNYWTAATVIQQLDMTCAADRCYDFLDIP